jgi:hypothetical protein
LAAGLYNEVSVLIGLGDNTHCNLPHDCAKVTPATKAKMAQRIVRSAHEGITDVQQLVAAAVAEGMEPAL